jgi:hypothetical protein
MKMMKSNIASVFNQKTLKTTFVTLINLLVLSTLLSLATPFLPISPFRLLCLAIPTVRMIFCHITPNNIPEKLKEFGIDTKVKSILGVLGLLAAHLMINIISPYFTFLGPLNPFFLADFLVLSTFIGICTFGIKLVNNPKENEKGMYIAALSVSSLYALQQIAAGALANCTLPIMIANLLMVITAIPSPLIGIALFGFSLYHLSSYALEIPSSDACKQFLEPLAFFSGHQGAAVLKRLNQNTNHSNPVPSSH